MESSPVSTQQFSTQQWKRIRREITRGVGFSIISDTERAERGYHRQKMSTSVCFLFGHYTCMSFSRNRSTHAIFLLWLFLLLLTIFSLNLLQLFSLNLKTNTIK